MDKEKIASGAVVVGLLLVVAGTALPLLRIGGDLYRWIYLAGAVLTFAGRLFMPYKGDDLRLKRLTRLEVWVGIIFLVGAFFMFFPKYGSGAANDWLAFTLAGGVIQIYTSIMIPRTARKNASGTENMNKTKRN